MLSDKQAAFVRESLEFCCDQNMLGKPSDWTDSEFEGLLRKLGFEDDHWLMKDRGVPKQKDSAPHVARSSLMTPGEFFEALK